MTKKWRFLERSLIKFLSANISSFKNYIRVRSFLKKTLNGILQDAMWWNHTIHFGWEWIKNCAYNCVIFFSKLVIWKKKTSYQSSNLWNIFREMRYTCMLTILFFQFALNSRYQRNIFVMFAALVSPCCYWRCLLKIQLT